ncbi:beta-1,3-galactosyl-O-glycosyl-glycoprotein beta-1,6-N-acetylglucosaminyltransferase 3-like [Gastrophryne carolinensis]
MVIHDQIEMFERLLRAVYAPQNIYCVHIDKKSPEEFKDAVRSIASCFDNVFVASKLVQVVYASWSRVEADFNCMTDLLQSNVRWKYLLNTCGTDFPLKTNAEIVRGLKVLNGRNSMESEKPASFKLGRWKHHYEVTDAIRETKEEKTPPPNNILLFTGNAYIVVCREFVEYIFKEPKVPKIQKFIDWIKDTYTPDELFWSTLTRMQDVPGSTPFSDKFQLSDMNAMARMIKWDSTAGDLEKGASYPACTGVYRRYACVYGSGDLSWMVKQHHFLANKFDPNVDNIAINCMEEFLRYKTIYLQDGTGSARDQICKDQVYEHFSLRPKEQGEINCSKIIHGDSETVKKALEIRESIKNNRFQLNEKMYLNLTKNCEHFRKFRKYITIPLSKEEENFPIAYSMVIHDKIEMFERLLRAVYAPQNIYCVHIDKKSPEEFKDAVRSITSCFDNVFVASKLVRVVYAAWPRVEADFNCMTDLLQSNVKWKYLLNTCGTDFPLKTNAEIVRGLKVLNGRNTMESERPSSSKQGRWKHHYEVTDDIRETSEEKTPPPINTPMFTGNAYIAISREFVEYIFKEPKIQKFIDWVKDTYSPDEHLWATLNRMPGVPGSTPFNDKFQLSDMNAMARMVKWQYHAGDLEKGASYPACTGVYRRAVCVYGSGDLSWMVKQHHFLANKFDPDVDNIAINCMEEFLRYKTIYRDEL